MSHHVAYDKLAREVLLWLVESGRLEAAAQNQLVAYQTWYLPPHIHLDLPDRDAYAGLLNPHTRDAHARWLGEAVVRVVGTEERDSWVTTSDEVKVTISLAIERSSPRATPDYGDGKAHARMPAPPVEETPRGEPLVRVTIEGQDEGVLHEGAGLLTVVRSRWRPRVSLMESSEDGPEVAFLLADGPTEVELADGRTQDYGAPARIPLTHDLSFRTRGRPLRPWERPVEGRIEVLGVSRMARPGVVLTARTGETTAWDRNTHPELEVGEGGGARVISHEVAMRLHSGARDRLDVAVMGERPQWVTWFDGRPMRVPASQRLPLQGAHLVALGREAGARIEVRVASDDPTPSPRVIEVHGWLPPPRADDRPFAGLFGFEQPVATVWEDGKLLEPQGIDEPVRVPVNDPALVGPLCLVALDGLPGCKVMALNRALAAEGHTLAPDTWTWLQGVVNFSLPGGRWRLESLGRLKLIYGQPRKVADLSADPQDAWRHQGWTVRAVGDTLEIGGGGRATVRLDRKPVDGPTRVPLGREHRLSIGRGLFRVVRRQSIVEPAGGLA